MVDQSSTLAEFYKGWETYQRLLIKAIKPLTDEQLALRAAPGLRSVLSIALHLIAVRVRWFEGISGDSRPDLLPIGAWDRPDQPLRSATELVDGLDKTWQFMMECIARWTPEDLQVTFDDEDDGQTVTYSRQWVIWHVIEHDLHHGGEISFSLGMHGVPAIDL